MFWRDITLSVWRKKTTGLKTKKRLLPLVLAAALCSSPVWAEEATFTANFKDTDLKSFIETVGANLNKTIIMGPGVQGKVSIRTMTPLNERQYYQLFLNLLEAQGYAVVPMENDVLKVVKSSAAKVEPLPLVGEGSDNYAGDEMVTKVVPVRNVSVRELAPILRQMIDSAGSGNVVNYDPSNVIMLTGRASVVERLTEVIQRVDHAGNRTEEVIPLDNASASEIARVLESLTKNSGENQPATLKSQIVADERTNSVIVSGDPATRDKMRRLIRRLDSEMERSGNSQVFYLKYSKAEDLVDVLKQVSGTLTAAKEEAEGTVGSGREIVSIAASKHSNALIVTAPQDIMQSLQSVIEQLDIRRAQVHVEALIVEVAEGSNINFGVQWASKDAGLMQFANGTQIPIGTLGAAISQAKPQKGSTVISENGATTINPDTNGDLSTLAQLLSGFSGTAVGVVKGDWMALVQAVKNDSSSNVLSTPSITTLDNQEAFFMVGQDVPVLTGSTVGSNNSNPFNTVERKKVGIMLKVTPQINEGNAVQMVIEQEVSKVEGQTSLDVVFGERKLKTTVLANDGERVVLRLLDKNQARLTLERLGLSQQLTAQLRQLLHKPHGIFLVTGPTGSGKSTTLYAGLQELNNHSRNILTVEDPIEYMIEGIGQTQVNTRVGMTFARGLRAILRQDPDVVMVGEIRDTETAEIAVQASLTGHLVLSTLHTNTAVGAITRLQDMGVEPFLLSSSLTGVMAQRLVRTLCPDCRQPAPATDEEKRLLGITDARTVTLYHPQGCPACNHKGFRGRTAIHELIVVDATLRDLIHRQAGELELERYVRQHSAGIRSNGIEKVLAGETSLDEVLRVTMEA
ncbi:TPA: type II secretion system secretin GspD [Escherichia coli]|nr:type II secretion system secretin GspD [Escherichia coli]HCN7726420.1 type II secretion system secretin GspD [Escherichia coli]